MKYSKRGGSPAYELLKQEGLLSTINPVDSSKPLTYYQTDNVQNLIETSGGGRRVKSRRNKRRNRKSKNLKSVKTLRKKRNTKRVSKKSQKRSGCNRNVKQSECSCGSVFNN